MVPFLLIQTRTDDDVARDELRSTTELGGFGPGELGSLRLEAEDQPVDWQAVLDAHAGIILGGSPFNAMDAEKSSLQLRVEEDLGRLLDLVVAQDYPFLGACYGVATLGLHQGGVVDREFGEPASAVTVTVTDDGAADPLLDGVGRSFRAWVGHKEAMSRLPENAVLLASGEACPVQMFRIGRNMYATQFHPELDAEGLIFRLTKYQNEGYFEPGTFEAVAEAVRGESVTEAAKVLSNFRARYRTQDQPQDQPQG